MKKRLIAIFIFYLLLRLFFSLNSENFSDDKSYYTLRQIEHIKETGKPLIHDSLSYGGRTFAVIPFYYYFMAFFYLFKNILILKIVQNVVASLILIIAYFLSERLLKNKNIALFCALAISCNPIYLESTVNTLTPLAVVVPLIVYIIYLFLDIKEKLNLAILAALVLSITSGSSIILIIGFVMYIILKSIYGKKTEKIEIEYISFFVMFFLWAVFILFKNAFQTHGFGIIHQNIPDTLRSSISILSLIAYIGPIFIALGAYSIYSHLFMEKNEELLLLTGMLVCIIPLSFLEAISFEYFVIFTSIILVIFSGNFIKGFLSFIEKSKIANLKKFLLFSLAVLLAIQLAFWTLSLNLSTYENSYVSAFRIIGEDIPRNSTIMAMPKDGNLIAYFGGKKNIMDTEYILAKDPELRYNDVNSFYNSKFRINSLRILEKYNADYFIVYNKSFSLSEDPCFSLVYLGELKIYKKSCDINE